MNLKGKIAEVFESIQGEGIFLGERQVFVRFYGCNLACSYCDTKLESFLEYEPQELADEIALYGNDLHSVSFTGGEPLAQKDFLKEVMRKTKAAGYKNYLETNGTLVEAYRDVQEFVDVVAMDFKLPSSTGLHHFWEEHREFLKLAEDKESFVKMVVCDATQVVDLLEGIKLIKETCSSAVIVLQPDSHDRTHRVFKMLDTFKQLCTDADVTCCVIPQIHKMVGLK